MTPTDLTREIAEVLMSSWVSPVTTKSDLARVKADYFAAAASNGYLTTCIGPDHYSRLWLVTPKGLRFLELFDPNVSFDLNSNQGYL